MATVMDKGNIIVFTKKVPIESALRSVIVDKIFVISEGIIF
jgi:hypothetical protein